MPVIIMEYLQSFAIDMENSTEERRHIGVTLSNGKVLKPVCFKVPAAATASEVDNFIEILRRGGSPNPFYRGINLIHEMVAIVDTMLSRAQSDLQEMAIYEARQRLEAGIWDLQNALSAITDVTIMTESMAVLEDAIEDRKSCLSSAAAEVTTAANRTIEALVYLHHGGKITEQQFDSDIHVISLNAFKLRVLKHVFVKEWFI